MSSTSYADCESSLNECVHQMVSLFCRGGDRRQFVPGMKVDVGSLEISKLISVHNQLNKVLDAAQNHEGLRRERGSDIAILKRIRCHCKGRLARPVSESHN